MSTTYVIRAFGGVIPLVIVPPVLPASNVLVNLRSGSATASLRSGAATVQVR